MTAALDIIREIVDERFVVARWAENHAEVECPGSGHHTNPGKIARVYIDKVPTVVCMHRSCRSEVEAANGELRRAVRQELRAAGLERQFTAEQKAEFRLKKAEEESRKREILRLETWASLKLLPKIVSAYRQPLAAWAAESLVPIIGTRPWHHPRTFLEACAPFRNERWWTAPNRNDHGYGKPWSKGYFNRVSELIAWPELSGRHVAPADFASCAHTRTSAAVIRRKLMVIELDNYSKEPEENKEATCAIARWLADENPEWGMKLFALVDSGNKSAHAWMTWPNIGPEDYEKFKAIMTGLGADTAFDRLEHSFRMPGAIRLNGVPQSELFDEEGRPKPEFDWYYSWRSCAWQKLIYLNPEAVEDYDRLPSSEQTHGKTLDLEELAVQQKAGFREADSCAFEQHEPCNAHRALVEREGL